MRGETAVTKRRVFYIPGYDPFPPRRYRELYRTESAKQAAISGYEIAQKQVKGDPNAWQVRARIGEEVSAAKIEVLIWSDIVQASMGHSVPQTYWQLLRTAWIYISTGTLTRLMWLRKGPILAALYPVGMLLAQLALAIGIGWAAGSLVGGLIWPPLGWVVALPLIAFPYRPVDEPGRAPVGLNRGVAVLAGVGVGSGANAAPSGLLHPLWARVWGRGRRCAPRQ